MVTTFEPEGDAQPTPPSPFIDALMSLLISLSIASEVVHKCLLIIKTAVNVILLFQHNSTISNDLGCKRPAKRPQKADQLNARDFINTPESFSNVQSKSIESVPYSTHDLSAIKQRS